MIIVKGKEECYKSCIMEYLSLWNRVRIHQKCPLLAHALKGATTEKDRSLLKGGMCLAKSRHFVALLQLRWRHGRKTIIKVKQTNKRYTWSGAHWFVSLSCSFCCFHLLCLVWVVALIALDWNFLQMTLLTHSGHPFTRWFHTWVWNLIDVKKGFFLNLS